MLTLTMCWFYLKIRSYSALNKLDFMTDSESNSYLSDL